MTFWPPFKRSNDWNWPPMTSNLQNKGTIEISDLKNLLEDTSHDTCFSHFIWPPFWPPILRLYYKIDLQWPPISELTTDLDSATPKTIEKTPNMTYMCWKWKIKILTSNVTSISGFFWMEVNSMLMIPFSEVRLIHGLPAKTKKIEIFFHFGGKICLQKYEKWQFLRFLRSKWRSMTSDPE